MPRYFFDTNDGHEVLRDPDGIELANREAARDAAMRWLPEAAVDRVPNGEQRQFQVVVRDESGTEILCATMTFNWFWIDGTQPD